MSGVCCSHDDKDCFGFCFGLTEKDDCGVCGGGNANKDSSGVCCEPHHMDCNRVCNGAAVEDACGVCGGINLNMDSTGVCCEMNQRDCTGICYGNAEPDKCGVCNGDDSSCCGKDGACSDNGLCSEEYQACECDIPYTGRFCQHERDMCRFHNCGENGHCTQTHDIATDDVVVKCICDEGWSGEKCNFFHCNERGARNSVAETCKCLSPYDTSTDCATCTKLEKNKVRLCVQGEILGHYRPLEFSEATGKRILNKGVYAVAGRDRRVYAPNMIIEGVHYDCGCRRKSAEKLKEEKEEQEAKQQGLTRFSDAAAEKNFNRLLIQMVDSATTSDAELNAITERTLDTNNREQVMPPLIFLGIGLIFIAILAIVLTIIACYIVPRWQMRTTGLGYRKSKSTRDYNKQDLPDSSEGWSYPQTGRPADF